MAQDSNNPDMEQTIKIRVICPKCNKSNNIRIPLTTIKSSGRGLTKVLIPAQTVCEHTFQIFVDRNGSIRGYETPDYELQFVIDKAEKKEEIGDKGKFVIFNSLFGNEIMYKLLRSLLNRYPIFCITENDFILKYFKDFIVKIFDSNLLTVCNMADYNNTYSKLVYGSKNKNAFVFNADIKTIIKEPFKSKYNPDDFKLEQSILSKISLETSSDEEIVKYFKGIIEKINDVLIKVIKELDENKLKNKKEVEAYVNK
ncbi:MAG: hypothetical protein ACTSU2_11870, partial [Promethearchaeota archaeon]